MSDNSPRDLLGTGDVARLLDTSPSNVCNIRDREHGFPAPFARPGGRPVWLRATIEAWRENTSWHQRVWNTQPRPKGLSHDDRLFRDSQIRGLRAEGLTLAAIGDLYDITRARVSQIVNQQPKGTA